MKNLNKKRSFFSVIAIIGMIGFFYLFNVEFNQENQQTLKTDKVVSSKKTLVVNDAKYDGPEKFAYYQSAIRAGQEDLNVAFKYPQYKSFSKGVELKKARQNRSMARVQATNATYIERGPANVPGRTRAIIVDPDDASSATWFAGNVSGGIWKTTNSGGTWTEIAPDLDRKSVV